MQKGPGNSGAFLFLSALKPRVLRMRKPAKVRAISLPADSRLDRCTSLVCLALVLAVLMLAARIASIW